MAEDQRTERVEPAGRQHGRPVQSRALELNWAGGDVYGRDLLDLNEVDSEFLNYNAYSSEERGDLFGDLSMRQSPTGTRGLERPPQIRLPPTSALSDEAESSEYPPTLLELEVQALAKVGVLKLYHGGKDLEREKARALEEERLARIQIFYRERQALSPVADQHQMIQASKMADLPELEKSAVARRKMSSRTNVLAPRRVGGDSLLELQRVAMSNLEKSQKASALVSESPSIKPSPGADLLELQRVTLSSMKATHDLDPSHIEPVTVSATAREQTKFGQWFEQNEEVAIAPESTAEHSSPTSTSAGGDSLELQKMASASTRGKQQETALAAATSLVASAASTFTKSSQKLGEQHLLELQDVPLRDITSAPRLTSALQEPTVIVPSPVAALEHYDVELLELQKVALKSIPEPLPTIRTPPPESQPSAGDLLELQKNALKNVPTQSILKPMPVSVSVQILGATVASQQIGGSRDLLELQKAALGSLSKQDLEVLQSAPPAASQQLGEDLLELQKSALRSVPKQPHPELVLVPDAALQENLGGDLFKLKIAALESSSTENLSMLAPGPSSDPSSASAPALALELAATPVAATASQQHGDDFLELQKADLIRAPEQSAPASTSGPVHLPAFAVGQHGGGMGDLLQLQRLALDTLSRNQTSLHLAQNEGGEDQLELQGTILTNTPDKAPSAQELQPRVKAAGHREENLLELQKLALAKMISVRVGEAELKSKEPKQEHKILTLEAPSLEALPSSAPFSTATSMQKLVHQLSAKEHALQSANEKIEEKNELLQLYERELATAAQLLDSMDVQCTNSKEAISKALADTEDICGRLTEACYSVDCFETLPSECCVGPQCGNQSYSSELPVRCEDNSNAKRDGHFFFGTETGMTTDQVELDERRGVIEELLTELRNVEEARREAQEGFESQIVKIEQLIVDLDSDFPSQVLRGLSCDHDPCLNYEVIPQESLKSREVNEGDHQVIIDGEHCEHCFESPSVEEVSEMLCDQDYGIVIDRATSENSFDRDAFVPSPSRETSGSSSMSDHALIISLFDNNTPGYSRGHHDHAYVISSDQIALNPCDIDPSFVGPTDHRNQTPGYSLEHAFVVQSSQNHEDPPSNRVTDGHSSASGSETVCPHFYEESKYIDEIPCDHLYEDKDQSREVVLREENVGSVSANASAAESVVSPLSMGFESDMPVSDALTRVESKVLAQLQAIDTENHHQQQAGKGNESNDQVTGQYMPLVVGNREANKIERARYSDQELIIKKLQSQLEVNVRNIGELHRRIEDVQAAVVWEQENGRKALIVKTIETQSDLEKSINIAKELRDQIHVLHRQSTKELEELRDRIHQLEDLKAQRTRDTEYLHNQVDHLERLNEQRSREIINLRDKVHQLESSLREEQDQNQQLRDQLQKAAEFNSHPPNTLSELRVKEISDLHQQFHRLHRELRQEKEANKRALAALADTQKYQAMAARDEKVKELQEIIADKEAGWQAEKHKMRKRIDEFETGLLVKEEEIIKLSQELEIVRKLPYFKPSTDVILGPEDHIGHGTDGAASPGFQKQYKEEESREVLDLRCEVLSLHDRLEMKTQDLKTTEKELGRSYQMITDLKSKVREDQELERSSWRPGQNRDLVRRIRMSEEKLRKFQDERAIMSKQIFDLSARCKYLEELEHMHKEGTYDHPKEQAVRDLESELERNVQIIKRMKARCTEYEARAIQAEARSTSESAALQRAEVRRIPKNEEDLFPQHMTDTKFTAQVRDDASDIKAEVEAECDRLRSEVTRYREQIEAKDKLLSQLQIDMQSQKKRQNPSPPSTTDEPVIILSWMDGGALGADMVSDDRKLKKPKTNSLLTGSNMERAKPLTLEVNTLRELLREQWKLQAIMEDRLNTMIDYVNERVDEFEKMTPSDATSELSLEPANELNHLHVEAKLMKVQLEQQLQVLRGTQFTSFQLEEAHRKVGLEPHDGDDQQLQQQAVDGRIDGRVAEGEGQSQTEREGRSQTNLTTQNFQLLVEKLALEGSAQTLQQKTSRLLNKLTAMRSELVQSTTGSDVSH